MMGTMTDFSPLPARIADRLEDGDEPDLQPWPHFKERASTAVIVR
jgi:hypothetical protein